MLASYFRPCCRDSRRSERLRNGGGRGIVQGVLLKLLVKDKLSHSREVPVNAKEWQLKPLNYFFLSPQVFQLPLFRYSLRYFYAVIHIETVNFCVKLFWYNM